jgi:outer membrane lipoprotein-sorting protein
MNMVRQWFINLFLFCSVTSLSGNEVLSSLKNEIPLYYGSFKATVQLVYSDGKMSSGILSYSYPNKLHIQQSNGSVIATNGVKLWLYSRSTNVCISQDVGKGYGGIIPSLSSYSGIKNEDGYAFERVTGYYRKIQIRTQDGMLRFIRLQSEKNTVQIKFSNIKTVKSFKASLFNFKPSPNTQLLENPLKR